jgi:hypothetical protein
LSGTVSRFYTIPSLDEKEKEGVPFFFFFFFFLFFHCLQIRAEQNSTE